MSGLLASLLAAGAASLILAAGARRVHSVEVRRRVAAWERRATVHLESAASTNNLAAPRLSARLLRRWSRPHTGDWAAALEEAARAVRTGSSLSSALVGTGEHASPRLQRAVALHGVGVPLAEALDADLHRADRAGRSSSRQADSRGAWAAHDRAADETFALAALQVAATVGGNVAATLDRAAGTLRERRVIRDDRAVHSAQARMSARVLSVLPIAFALWCVSTDRRVAHFLLSSPAGWACLATGATLNLTGWWWMRRIIGSVGRPA